MKKFILLLLTVFSVSTFAQQAVVDIKLRPAGSFKAKTGEVSGFATMKGNEVTASNIVVKLGHIETGIGVRDEHTRKHLEVEKFPEAVLVSAKGTDGKGEGTIKIRGVEKKVTGTYKIEGANLVAEFAINLPDFNITGIKYMGVGVADEAKITVTVPVKK